MFLTERKGIAWVAGSAVAGLVLAGLYLWRQAGSADAGSASGSSVLGLFYGSLALALLLVLGYFGVRKRRYHSTAGTLVGWLRAHVCLGLLVVLVVLLHGGFQLGDPVAAAAFWCLLAVVASGLVGVALYATVPRLMTEVETNRPAAEVSRQLHEQAEAMARIAAGRSEAFQRVYRRLQPESSPPALAGWRLLLHRQRRGRRSGADADLAPLLVLVDAGERDPLRRIAVLSRQRKELQQRWLAEQRYRNLMDAWLYLHLPLSAVLLLLVAAHLVAVAYWAL